MPLPCPILLPGLARVWRGPHTLQLGADPDHAVLLDLPGRDAATVLDLIDGTRTERSLLRRAAHLGLPAPALRALIATLTDAGLLAPVHALLPAHLAGGERHRLFGEATALALRPGPAPQPLPAVALGRRRAATVRIAGEGRLGAGLAVALATAGVGRLVLDVTGEVTSAELAGTPVGTAGVGGTWRQATEAVVRAVAPEISTHGARQHGPVTMQVQLRFREPVALLAAALSRRERPHLALRLREGLAVVGPFVTAGGRPCLNCVDLHRRDRDPGWSEPPPSFEPAAVTTILAATAFAAAEVLTHLDGGAPESLGAAIEITRPGHHRRRSWPPHPGCFCARR